jgi:hypothetical protein
VAAQAQSEARAKEATKAKAVDPAPSHEKNEIEKNPV